MAVSEKIKIIREFSEKEKIYLETLRLLNEFSEQIGTRTYVFGGLTLDIWVGGLLRSHHDIDCLTENLHSLEDEFDQLFSHAGYETKHLTNDDFKAEKGDVKVQFGHLDIKDGRVEWTHNGDKGSIFFPEDWLDRDAHDFYGSKAYTVKPELEYVLKIHPELMNPEWIPRNKDLAARQKLTEILQSRSIELSALREQVESA